MASGVTRRRHVSGLIALGCAEDWADGRRFFGSSRPCPASSHSTEGREQQTGDSDDTEGAAGKCSQADSSESAATDGFRTGTRSTGSAAETQRRGRRSVPPRAMGGAAPRRRCRRVRPTHPVPTIWWSACRVEPHPSLGPPSTTRTASHLIRCASQAETRRERGSLSRDTCPATRQERNDGQRLDGMVLGLRPGWAQR